MAYKISDFNPETQEKIKRKLAGGKKPVEKPATAAGNTVAAGTDPNIRMNKTERAFADHLERKRLEEEIRDWKFEPFKLRLAKKTFYTPDFVAVTRNGNFEIIEVKGFWRDDARVKIKVAAEQFPWFIFVAVTKGKKGESAWKYERFNL